MRKALMKAEGALGRWEFERLKHENSGFLTKGTRIPILKRGQAKQNSASLLPTL